MSLVSLLREVRNVAAGLRACSVCIDASMHTYILTCMHTCIHTYRHTYMNTYIHTYIVTVIRTYIHAYMQACAHV